MSDSEAPRERRLSNVRGYRDRYSQSGRRPGERGQGREGGSVAPRETHSSFGEAVFCPIIEGSVEVAKRRVCHHFAEGKVDPSCEKRLQFVGCTVEKIPVGEKSPVLGREQAGCVVHGVEAI